MWFPIVLISTPDEMKMGVDGQAVCVLNRFLPCEVKSGISVLIADGRCFLFFSGTVGKFGVVNLL